MSERGDYPYTQREEFQTLCALAAWGYACGDSHIVAALVEQGMAQGEYEYATLTFEGKKRLVDLLMTEAQEVRGDH